MKDIFLMWRNTRMVVLTAICAAVYVAVLIPFKLLPIIPGFTEVRPAAIVPIVCSILFGPAAAWGAGFGNVIGDFIGGMFGLGSLFGFLGNFLLGFVPYKLFSVFRRYDPAARDMLSIVEFILIILITCSGCSMAIGWGVDLLGFVPFIYLAGTLFLNNLILNCLLSPFALALIYPRVKTMGLIYTDVMGLPEEHPHRNVAKIGAALMAVGAITGMAAGLPLSFLDAASGYSAVPIPWALAPFIACMFVAVVLL